MAVERQAVHAGRCPTLQSSRPRARIRSLAAAHRDVMQTEFGSLDLVAAKWVLGRIPSEALPRIASDLLEAGRDTPTLRRLAGELRPTLGESGPLFEEILDELGVAVPDVASGPRSRRS